MSATTTPVQDRITCQPVRARQLLFTTTFELPIYARQHVEKVVGVAEVFIPREGKHTLLVTPLPMDPLADVREAVLVALRQMDPAGLKKTPSLQEFAKRWLAYYDTSKYSPLFDYGYIMGCDFATPGKADSSHLSVFKKTYGVPPIVERIRMAEQKMTDDLIRDMQNLHWGIPARPAPSKEQTPPTPPAGRWETENEGVNRKRKEHGFAPIGGSSDEIPPKKEKLKRLSLSTRKHTRAMVGVSEEHKLVVVYDKQGVPSSVREIATSYGQVVKDKQKLILVEHATIAQCYAAAQRLHLAYLKVKEIQGGHKWFADARDAHAINKELKEELSTVLMNGGAGLVTFQSLTQYETAPPAPTPVEPRVVHVSGKVNPITEGGYLYEFDFRIIKSKPFDYGTLKSLSDSKEFSVDVKGTNGPYQKHMEIVDVLLTSAGGGNIESWFTIKLKGPYMPVNQVASALTIQLQTRLPKVSRKQDKFLFAQEMFSI